MDYADAIIRTLAQELQLPDGFECKLWHYTAQDHNIAVQHRRSTRIYAEILVRGDCVKLMLGNSAEKGVAEEAIVPLYDPDCFDIVQRFVTVVCEHYAERLK